MQPAYRYQSTISRKKGKQKTLPAQPPRIGGTGRFLVTRPIQKPIQKILIKQRKRRDFNKEGALTR